MTTATIATPKKEEPLLFEGLTWREFKAVASEVQSDLTPNPLP
jgi:hypothetical protein